MTREEIAEGGKHALVLCGYGPFGDCQSIRIRLDMARKEIDEKTRLADEVAETEGEKDWVVQQWRREVKAWKYALKKGEKLLAKELKNPKTTR